MTGDFGRFLIKWYAQNKRLLPWRNTGDPYKIWLSEIILQQTRVNQGTDYYLRFINEFPDIFSLAKATEQKIYKLWQGLGYYNRADNLMRTARLVADKYQGHFPDDFETLKTLPGIGDYTAAAIASLAFNKPHPVVDGNVFRVLTRIFGIRTPVNTTRGKKELTTLARELMAEFPPSEFNEALMEFGALHCTPQNPRCKDCIFRHRCFAAGTGKQADFPVKKKKAPVKNRFFYYFVIFPPQNNNALYLRKRTDRDIWRNLYDFPAFVTEKALSAPSESLKYARQNILSEDILFAAGTPSPFYTQQLTHLKVSACFIPLFLKTSLPGEAEKSLSLVSLNQLSNYPVPKLISRYLQDEKFLK